jgi:hypothetical protein
MSENDAMSNHSNPDELALTHEVHEQITVLLTKLEQVNKHCADTARPLDRLSELDSEHRRELARNIRAANEEWEEVTRQISEALSLLNNPAAVP